METLQFSSQLKNDFLLLPGIFIDCYMKKANGEYVKVYLYLLRAISTGRELSIEKIAEDLDHTQRDIIRALTYWDSEKLIRLGFNAQHKITSLVLLSLDSQDYEKEEVLHQEAAISADLSTNEETTSSSRSDSSQESLPTDTPKPQRIASLEDLAQDESFGELCFLAQTYTKKTLSARDTERIGYWYILYDCSYDIIEYLLEYCVEMGHPNVNYMEKVVLSWHESGLRTVEEIKDHSRKYNKITYKIMRAFGINDRSPSPKESQLIQKWTQTYGFDIEMMEAACERTIAAIQKPSFAYADSILTAWNKNGCKTKEDLAAYDANHQKKRQKETSKLDSNNRSQNQNKSNKFHNFEQRSTDYNKLVADYYGYPQE